MGEAHAVSLIEDEKSALQHYSKLIGQDGRLRVKSHLIKDEGILGEVTKAKPDLILVDYELSKSSVFRGAGLASMLRECLPNTPIVIISNPNILNERMPAILDALGEVDEIVYKDEIDQHPHESVTLMVEIIKGFAKLNANLDSDINTVFSLMGAKEREEVDLLWEAWQFEDRADMILKTKAPQKTDLLVKWSTPQVSKWILRVLFRYPGILYDELYAATSLGISVQSFLSSEVQELLDATRYRGIFDGIKNLWWKHRLYGLSYRLLSDAGFDPPLSKNFGNAFERKHGIKLDSSRDAGTNEEHADTVCYKLRMPFVRKNTLEARVDNRPPFMDPARVSFKALNETDFNLDLLTPEGREIVKGRR